MRRDEPLGLVLGALVGVAEARAAARVVLVDDAAPVAGDVRGRDVREALEIRAGPGEVQHLARARDVDDARLLEREIERDGRRTVDDRADALRGRLPAIAEAEPRSGDVAGDRGHAVLVIGGGRLAAGAVERGS